MATTPFEPIYTGASLFDIYTDGITAPRASPGLPGGGCNFVDLSPGANGAKCGCRRFWTRQQAGSPVQDQSGWCMCNHHACYHDHGPRTDTAAPMDALEQENERPRILRAPLSPVVALEGNSPYGMPSIAAQQSFGQNAPYSLAQNQNVDLGPAAPYSAPRPQGSLPDTLAWGDLIQSQAGQEILPPIPSQCLMPSQATSTTSSAHAKYLRPFAGKGLGTLNGDAASGIHSPDHAARGAGAVGIKGHKMAPPRAPSVLEPPCAPESQAEQDTMPLTVHPDENSKTLESGSTRDALQNITDTVAGHERRLDRLETVSFTATAHDDCLERSDQMDLRVTDLEGRMDEVEKLVNDNASAIGGRNKRVDDCSQSVASFATNTTSHPTHSQELQSQVLALQAQVTLLQASLPSFTHPWEVEVVFLPFPLQRVWQGPQDFRNDTPVTKDDWTQMPMTYSTPTMRSQSPYHNNWTASGQTTDWLLPKACGNTGLIDKRLRSRGLIQTVSVKGPDARSVNTAMVSVFGQIMREMDLVSPSSEDPRASKFLGLQSSWVPLRKIHKDSRLRFLSPAEMLTPALWDVQFLSSVMMRSTEPRLFITHPDAYLQDEYAHETGWSWHRVRTMTRVYSDVTESQEVPEADAMEACWAHNEQLDQVLNAPENSGQPRRLVSSSPSQQFFPAKQSWSSPSQALPQGQPTLLKGRRASRPPHIRTTSVPISRPPNQSPASARRRVISNERSRRSTPSALGTSQSAVTKRRQTRSPSRARFTPRWTASPSPGPMGLGDRQFARGTTPFAYATPHSNAPLQEIRPVRASSAVPDGMDFADQYDDDFADQYDDDFDIHIYESGSESAFNEEDSNSLPSEEPIAHAQPRPISQLYGRLPEDEPWPGIEDQDIGSDGENIDPTRMDVETASVASSQPSEYPSTNHVLDEDLNVGFLIHED